MPLVPGYRLVVLSHASERRVARGCSRYLIGIGTCVKKQIDTGNVAMECRIAQGLPMCGNLWVSG